MDVFKPQFWKEYVKKREAKFKTKNVANKSMWEEMAHYYKDFEKEKSYEELKTFPIKYLKEKGILNKNITVADICCGPGTHAIDFAKSCKEIFAFDISEKMLEELKNKANKENVSNIRVKCNDFFKENFNEKFDLVFVSMSPILNDLETVDKLLTISNRYLFLIFWAGKRENKIFNKCYKAIFNEDFEWDILDITVIFNYLYSLGYVPEIFYKDMVWENKFDFEKVYNHTLWHLKFYKNELTDKEKEVVRNILEKENEWKTFLRIGFVFLDKKNIF